MNTPEKIDEMTLNIEASRIARSCLGKKNCIINVEEMKKEAKLKIKANTKARKFLQEDCGFRPGYYSPGIGKNLKEIITGDIVLIRKVLKKLGIKQKGSKLRKGTTLAFSGYESMWNRLVTQKAKEILKKKRLVFC